MKKIELKAIKAKKHWNVSCGNARDVLVVGAVLSAAGVNWEPIGMELSGGELVHGAVRVYCGKKRAAQLQKLLSGMSEVGALRGSIAYEVYPHR